MQLCEKKNSFFSAGKMVEVGSVCLKRLELSPNGFQNPSNSMLEPEKSNIVSRGTLIKMIEGHCDIHVMLGARFSLKY